jgi:hypothetical protein
MFPLWPQQASRAWF